MYLGSINIDYDQLLRALYYLNEFTWRRVLRTPSLFQRESPKFAVLAHNVDFEMIHRALMFP